MDKGKHSGKELCLFLVACGCPCVGDCTDSLENGLADDSTGGHDMAVSNSPLLLFACIYYNICIFIISGK